MTRQTAARVTLFVLLAAGLLAGWYYAERELFPKKPPAVPPPPPPAREFVMALTGGIAGPTEPIVTWPHGYVAELPKAEPKVEPAPGPAAPPPAASEPAEPHLLVALGEGDAYQHVLLDTKGAVIQQVILPKFHESTREGREAKDAAGQPRPLHLIPGFVRKRDAASIRGEDRYLNLVAGPVGPGSELAEGSYALLHYPAPGDPARLPDDQTPDKYCSRLLADRTWKLVEHVAAGPDGEAKAVFETDLKEPYFLRLRKTFTLRPKEYHVAMRLDFEALPGREAGKAAAPFRYQIVGPRELPTEGEWYGSNFRNAHIGWSVGRTAYRDVQDAATVAVGFGGPEMVTKGTETFAYAGVANQYFASLLAPDEAVPEDARRKLWEYVRATREPHPWDEPGKDALVNLTVRAVARPIDPRPGQPVSHSYVVYNGPTKVRLLGQLAGDRAVDPALVARYHDGLRLYALSDAPLPNGFSRFSHAVYWGDLIIWLTNRMHGILGVLHAVVPSWGLDILLLTAIVRLALFYPSRRQQATMKRLQEKTAQLQPEIDKLKAKHGADVQAFNREKMQLMMRNGANPLGSLGGCLTLILQIPIFFSLYSCLQESVLFRLEPFLFVPNLAAPDMLLWWTEKIPVISNPANIGETYYLGPFLNLLPLLAVGLMFVHQKLTMPPPTDEQQEMQQRMMKIMMLVTLLFFYKFAAGVCLYFILSTGWGLAERRLLPKPKAAAAPAPAVGDANAPPAGPPGFLGRLQARMEAMQKLADQQRQIRNTPRPAGNGPPPVNGKGKKKKRK